MKYFVIGAGSIGQRHHTNLLALGADVSLHSWRGFDLNDLSSLLRPSSKGRAAIVIATASQVRHSLIAAAAAADVPVYIEKPVAYRLADLDRIYDVAHPIAARSMVGFMMRYHPIIHALAVRDLDDTYGFSMEIGHDVRQWRKNWSFKDSYAANPDGGGVLLDLCHELDIAHVLFPNVQIQRVDCLGHADFVGVDFSTRVTLAQSNGPSGTVSMDYLSPHSLRRINLRGRENISDIDLLTCTEHRSADDGTQKTHGSFERNTMFLDIMRDFMVLAETGKRPQNPIAPLMDQVYDSCKLIAQAWEAREFHGAICGGMT